MLPTQSNTSASDITFGERLKLARKAAGLGQTDLADRIGKTQSSISQWERGESSLSLDVLVLLSTALGVTTDWLLGVDKSEFEAVVVKRRHVTGMALLSELSAACASDELSDTQIDLMADLLLQFREAARSSRTITTEAKN
jgi:transcriptional regulator with XRE-family HTH domain